MKITIRFSGEMEMDIDIAELMENELKDLVENHIQENIHELMDCNVSVEE